MLCPFQRFSSFFSHRDHLQTLFDKAEVAFDVDSDLDRARLVTAQIRYYENLKKKLVERETEFGMIRWGGQQEKETACSVNEILVMMTISLIVLWCPLQLREFHQSESRLPWVTHDIYELEAEGLQNLLNRAIEEFEKKMCLQVKGNLP